jgi:hypothetical protein
MGGGSVIAGLGLDKSLQPGGGLPSRFVEDAIDDRWGIKVAEVDHAAGGF